MRELLTRRIGPLPFWVWFVVFVLAGALFLHWRKGKSSSSSNVEDAPNLTDQPSTLVPYTTDIFVNVQQPAQPTPPAQTGTKIPIPKDSGLPRWPSPTKPPPRQTSITYKVLGGDTLSRIAARYHTTANALYAANKSLIEAQARQHGFSSSQGGHWIFPGERLIIPT